MGESILIGGACFMLIVQLLAFRIRGPWARWIPLGLILLGELYCVGEYYGIYSWSHGWHELGAVIVAMAIGIWGIGIVLGWAIHIVKHWIKK
ncbi:MAG: hypothetical protein IIX88_03035 [Firmicutes bacterium]|nr:hypothetical protein [Bacillota bacterium]MBQ2271009.1 hypothetical protein [Bacillota bacterium]MBQ5796724.1 hypothetical protein [Bacillota bacterium]